MESESFSILKTLLDDLVEEAVSKALDKRKAQEVNLVEKLDEIKAILRRQQLGLGISVEDGEDDEDLILTFWHKKDLVFMSDERLFNREKYPNCPFKSRQALQRIRTKNPELFFKNNEGYLVAIAEDLFNYVCNKQARDIAAGKGIKLNNKRK